VATCYRGLKAMASAETDYETALRWARSAGAPDHSRLPNLGRLADG